MIRDVSEVFLKFLATAFLTFVLLLFIYTPSIQASGTNNAMIQKWSSWYIHISSYFFASILFLLEAPLTEGCVISKSQWSYHEATHTGWFWPAIKTRPNSLWSLGGNQVFKQNMERTSSTNTNSVSVKRQTFFILFCCLIYWQSAIISYLYTYIVCTVTSLFMSDIERVLSHLLLLHLDTPALPNFVCEARCSFLHCLDIYHLLPTG